MYLTKSVDMDNRTEYNWCQCSSHIFVLPKACDCFCLLYSAESNHVSFFLHMTNSIDVSHGGQGQRGLMAIRSVNTGLQYLHSA